MTSGRGWPNLGTSPTTHRFPESVVSPSFPSGEAANVGRCLQPAVGVQTAALQAPLGQMQGGATQAMPEHRRGVTTPQIHVFPAFLHFK